MSVFERLSNENSNRIIELIEDISNYLNNYIEAIKDTKTKVPGDILDRTYAEILKNILASKIIQIKNIIRDNQVVFENNEISHILINDLLSFISFFHDIEEPEDVITQESVLKEVKRFLEKFENIQLSIISLQNANNLISELEKQVEKAKISAQNVESAKLAIEANKTDIIYLELSDKYEVEYEDNNKYFRNSLIITVACTVLSIAYTFNTPIGEINWLVFISTKILILAVGLTLCTLFLRRSAHAKKMYEKAYQTHVEINAYPIFIKSLKEEDQQEITKELALRYFGNDIDQTQNDKIGDLVQDQLSAGTELIRASAEMVRAKQGKE